MKKILIAIMIMTATLSANVQELSYKIKVADLGFYDAYFLDVCIGTQVWRLYGGGYQGSLSQLTVSWGGGSIPLLCEDYGVFAKLNGIEVR